MTPLPVYSIDDPDEILDDWHGMNDPIDVKAVAARAKSWLGAASAATRYGTVDETITIGDKMLIIIPHGKNVANRGPITAKTDITTEPNGRVIWTYAGPNGLNISEDEVVQINDNTWVVIPKDRTPGYEDVTVTGDQGRVTILYAAGKKKKSGESEVITTTTTAAGETGSVGGGGDNNDKNSDGYEWLTGGPFGGPKSDPPATAIVPRAGPAPKRERSLLTNTTRQTSAPMAREKATPTSTPRQIPRTVWVNHRDSTLSRVTNSPKSPRKSTLRRHR
jgi:hypothetical protein